jgi:hypothetical protein
MHLQGFEEVTIMPHRCGHESCNCDTQGKEYCSTHCATAASFEEEKTTCECHHTACRQPHAVE